MSSEVKTRPAIWSKFNCLTSSNRRAEYLAILVGQSAHSLPSSLFHPRILFKSSHARRPSLALSCVADPEWASRPRDLLRGEVARVVLVDVEVRRSLEDHARTGRGWRGGSYPVCCLGSARSSQPLLRHCLSPSTSTQKTSPWILLLL